MDIRQAALEEISEGNVLYSGFNTCFNFYEMSTAGKWNTDLGDLLPYAVANILGCKIKIFSSHAQRKFYTVKFILYNFHFVLS